jgi:heme/copper-type cytochrome/quinol oxidase subunit 2
MGLIIGVIVAVVVLIIIISITVACLVRKRRQNATPGKHSIELTTR